MSTRCTLDVLDYAASKSRISYPLFCYGFFCPSGIIMSTVNGDNFDASLNLIRGGKGGIESTDMILDPNDYTYEYFDHGQEGDSGAIYIGTPKKADLCSILVKNYQAGEPKADAINEFIPLMKKEILRKCLIF